MVETPLMKQYIEMKGKHPDAILLFRVGDFYETFSEDAITASEILGITDSTTRTHIQRIHNKLGVNNNIEVASWAHEHRIV